jgi:beta-galactosidase/beta-glucuronidase
MQSITVSDPLLWSLEDPYLYRVVVELQSAGKMIDRKVLRLVLEQLISSQTVFF